MSSQTIALKDLGMSNQSDERYEEIDAMINGLDEMDKCRLMWYISTQIIKDEIKMHPVALIKMMETMQNTEIMCAKLKKMLGDVIVDGVVCKKCGKSLPKMTIMHHLSCINSECPHDAVEMEITKKE